MVSTYPQYKPLLFHSHEERWYSTPEFEGMRDIQDLFVSQCFKENYE